MSQQIEERIKARWSPLVKKLAGAVWRGEKCQEHAYLDFNDLMQTGYVALIEAYRTYDNTQHTTKFKTYAYTVIYRTIRRMVHNMNALTVQQQKHRRMGSYKGWEKERYKDPLSLQYVDDNNVPLSERVPGDYCVATDAVYQATLREVRGKLSPMLAGLNTRERRMMAQRFVERTSFREIAAAHHISAQRAQQIIKRVLERLRNLLFLQQVNCSEDLF